MSMMSEGYQLWTAYGNKLDLKRKALKENY